MLTLPSHLTPLHSTPACNTKVFAALSRSPGGVAGSLQLLEAVWQAVAPYCQGRGTKDVWEEPQGAAQARFVYIRYCVCVGGGDDTCVHLRQGVGRCTAWAWAWEGVHACMGRGT